MRIGVEGIRGTCRGAEEGWQGLFGFKSFGMPIKILRYTILLNFIGDTWVKLRITSWTELRYVQYKFVYFAF